MIPPRAPLPAFGLLLAAALLAGCDGDAARWHGYAFDNLLSDAAAHDAGTFATPEACLATMRARQHNAPAIAGFACARGCTSTDHFMTGCEDVRI